MKVPLLRPCHYHQRIEMSDKSSFTMCGNHEVVGCDDYMAGGCLARARRCPQRHDVNGHDFVWRRLKLYVTDLRDGSGRAINRGDVHTFYVTDHLRDGLRNHSSWEIQVSRAAGCR